MKKITRNTSLRELAIIVGGCLKQNHIDAVLTGGAVVSIYSNNQYQSDDLDFITFASSKEISISLEKIGFQKTKGRYYVHESTDYIIEFPSGPVSIGNKPITTYKEIKLKDGYLKLLTPTHCVMDRLAAFYYWDDWQSLDQAILVAKDNEIDMNEVKNWSKEEHMAEKYNYFIEKLNQKLS